MSKARPLSEDEQALRERRLRVLPGFINTCAPTLMMFADELGLQAPETLVSAPYSRLEQVSNILAYQDVEEDKRMMRTFRLVYLLGATLIERRGGQWLLNDVPDTNGFLKFVVGPYRGQGGQRVMVEPHGVVETYLDSVKPRDFKGVVDEALAALTPYDTPTVQA